MRKELNEERLKEMTRLERLIEESGKQKTRCVKAFAKDVHRIGVSEFARYVGVSNVYIYKVIRDGIVSPENLKELWEKAYYYVGTFKLDK